MPIYGTKNQYVTAHFLLFSVIFLNIFTASEEEGLDADFGHQNFTQVFNSFSCAEKISLRNQLKLKPKPKPKQLANHLNNPFLTITATLCHKIERHVAKPKGWMDEQHIDSDGLCDFFSDDLREILTIYSDLDTQGRAMLLEMSRTINKYR